MRITSLSILILAANGGVVAAQTLNNLGAQYYANGQYSQAEKYLVQARKTEAAPGADAVEATIKDFNLAAVYRAQARYGEAEPLYRRVLATREAALGPNHPSLAAPL